MKHEIKWLDAPEKHDFPAAKSFLSLHFSEKKAKKLVKRLRRGRIKHFAAKDVLRASGLRPLGKSNKHVAHNRKRVKKGKRLSPVLLVRDKQHLRIADGFHRCCAVHLINEDALIPCRIV